MATEFKFGSKKSTQDQNPRAALSFKEMNIQEHMALQLLIAMLHSENYHYVNTEDEDGNIIFGEDKYAVDAVLAARALMSSLHLSDADLKKKYDEVHPFIEEEEEDDDDNENQ